jgi:hypothetical protein
VVATKLLFGLLHVFHYTYLSTRCQA